MGAEENVELVRQAYETWARGAGLDAFLEGFVHPEIEWLTPPTSPEPGPHRGHDGVRRAMGAYLESFDVFIPEAERIVPAADPDKVLVFARTHTRGRGSGVEVSVSVAHLLTLREDKIIRFEVITDPAEALQAAGLDHDAIE